MSLNYRNELGEYIEYLQKIYQKDVEVDQSQDSASSLRKYLDTLTTEFLNEKNPLKNKSCVVCLFPHHCVICFNCKEGIYQDKFGKNNCKMCGYPEVNYTCSKCGEGVCKNCWHYEVLDQQ